MALKFVAHHLAMLLLLLHIGLTQTAAAQKSDAREIRVESMTTVLIRYAQISSREAGVVQSINVRTGEHVSAGQLLMTLDAERQALAVTAAELNLVVAELNSQNDLPLDAARSAVREAEQKKVKLQVAADIAQRLASSDVEIRLAEKIREASQFELERAQRARESFSGSVSPAELNRLKVLFDQRTLEIEKAREDREVASLRPLADVAAVEEQAEILTRYRVLLAQEERQLQIARAERDVTMNDLNMARLQLDRRSLQAPFDGTVVAIEKQPGEWVEPGQVVLRLIQLNPLRVEGFIEASAAKLNLTGRSARLSFPSDPERAEIEAMITFVSPEIDPLNQQVRIWAEFSNQDLAIQPGLLVTMRITLPDAPAGKPPRSGGIGR